nr:DUF3592 domain-containing protein [Rhizobium leguminosarum]
MACATASLFALVTFLKWKEVQAARSWLPARGTIISSRIEAREVRISISGANTTNTTEIRNFPAITFKYTVNGSRFEGTRYTFRSQIGNFQIPETLARYPMGAEVTVYYDPSDPRKSVIERTMPDDSIKIMAYISAGLVVGSVTLVFLVGGVVDAIRPHLPGPQNAGAGMLLTIMALIVLRMGFAQKATAEAAAKWPTTQGSISSSGIEAFRIRSAFADIWLWRWRIVFKSRIRYAYTVADRDYASGRVAFGATFAASLPALIDGDSRRYAEGSKVDVHYDPSNPAIAVLECRVRGLWTLWGLAGAMLIGAAVLVGLPAQ